MNSIKMIQRRINRNLKIFGVANKVDVVQNLVAVCDMNLENAEEGQDYY